LRIKKEDATVLTHPLAHKKRGCDGFDTPSTCQTSEVFFTVRFYGTWCRHADRITELQNEVKELKEYIEEAFADYNDINDDTRMQLELINQTLAELQSKKSISDKPRPRIGFVK